MPYVDVRIHIAEEHDTEPDGSTYTHYEVTKVSRIDTDLPEDAEIGLQEGLAQSDFGNIDYAMSFITVLDGTEVTFNR